MKNRNKGLVSSIFGLFSSSRMTPAELYQSQVNTHSIQTVNPRLLKQGVNRQWKRLHDPEFQTQEIISNIDRLIPIRKS